eukprot:GILK01002450.1.p1 GENE.GILK01002450.1~~GILK01002450.1.p1  ORF type:complete len:1301 (+),score=391.70 GILK01002450.1:3152-7054(+)
MEVESTAEPTPKAKKEKKEKKEKKPKKEKEQTQSVEGEAMEEDKKEEAETTAKKPAKTEKKTKEDASLNQQRNFFAKFLGIAPKPAAVVPVATSPSKEADVVIVQETTLEPATALAGTGAVSPSVKVSKTKLTKKSDATDALLFQPYQIPCDTILKPAIRYATLSAEVQKQIMAAVEQTWRPTEHSDDNNDAMEVDVGSLQCWLPRWKKMKQNPKRASNRVRDAEVEVIEQTDVQMESKRKDRKKYIKHHDSVSKPFYGPWVNISTVIRPRKPFIRDLALVDYEAESEDEEEGEEVGDSGEEDEKDEEAPVEEEQEEEERWIVPDGYLSEDEVPEEEAEMQRKQNEMLLNGEGDELQQSGVMTVTDKKEGVSSSAAPGSSMARPIRQQHTLHRILIAPHESTSELDISLAKMLSAFEVVPFGQTPIIVQQTVKVPTAKSKGSKKNSPPRAGSNGESTVEGGSQPEQPQSVQKRTKKIDEPEYLKALVKMIHGSDSSLQKLITQYKENHELVSKKSVEEKIKEIASKSRREGTVKTCWYVNEPVFKSLDFSSDELELFRPVSLKVASATDIHTTTDKQKQAADTFPFKTPSPKAKTKSSLMKKKSKALTAAIFATPNPITTPSPSPVVCLSASSTVASIDSPLADVIVCIAEHEPETPIAVAAYCKQKEEKEEAMQLITTHGKGKKETEEKEGEGGVESPVSAPATKTTAATKKVFAPVSRVTLDAFFKRTPAKQDTKADTDNNNNNNKTSASAKTNTVTAAVSKPVTISKTLKEKGMNNKNKQKKDDKMKQSATVVIDLDAPETVPVNNDVKSSTDNSVQKRKLNEEATEKKKNNKKAKIDKPAEEAEQQETTKKTKTSAKQQKKKSKVVEAVAAEPVAVKKRGPPADRSKPPVSKKQKAKHNTTEEVETEGKMAMAVETVIDDDDVVVISEETNEATAADEPMQVEPTAESSQPSAGRSDVQMTEAAEQDSESTPIELDSQTSETAEIVSELITALSESVSDPQTVVAGCMDLLHSYFFIDCPQVLPDPLLTALLSVISHSDVSSDLRSRSVRSISNYFGGVSMTVSENPQVLKDDTMLKQIREIFTCLEDCVSAEQTAESTLLFKNIFRLLLSLSSLACLDDNVEHHVVFEQLRSELWLNRFMAALKDNDSQVRAYVTAVLDHMVGVTTTRMVLVEREKEKKDVMSSLLYAYSGQMSAASASNLGPRKYTIKMLTSLLSCENFQTEQLEPLCAFITSCLRDEKQPVLQNLSVACVEKMLDCHWTSLSEESSSQLKSALGDLVQTPHKEAVEAILTRRQ